MPPRREVESKFHIKPALSPRRNGEYLFNAFIIGPLSAGGRPERRAPLTNCGEKEVFFSFYPHFYPATIDAPGACVDPPAPQEVGAGRGKQRPLQPHAGGPLQSPSGARQRPGGKCGIRIARIKLNTYFRERSRGSIILSTVKCRAPRVL